MKNILHIWFSHFTLTETHRCLNYSLLLYFNKKIIPVDPLIRQLKPSLKLLGSTKQIQNDVHINILLQTRTHIMTISQHNSIYKRFLSPTYQKCAKSSTFWQFFYHPPPGKFRYAAESLKCDANNSTYEGFGARSRYLMQGISNYIPKFTVGCNYLCLPEIPASGAKVLIYQYIDITLSIIKKDFLYQFNLRSHHFSSFFFQF